MTRAKALGLLAGAVTVAFALGYLAKGLRSSGAAPALAAPGTPSPAATIPAPSPAPGPAPPPLVVRVIAEAAPPPTRRAPKTPGPSVSSAASLAPPAAASAATSPAATSAADERPSPSPTPGRAYRVVLGDTLTEITTRAYGSARRLIDVLKANPGIDPDRLKVGAVVHLPVAPERDAARVPPAPSPAPTAPSPAAASPTPSVAPRAEPPTGPGSAVPTTPAMGA